MFSAKVNVVISQISILANALGILPVIARIILGPFPTITVVFVYYLYRLIFTFLITLLTVNTILKTAFILDFNMMAGTSAMTFPRNTNTTSGFSDSTIVLGSLVLSSILPVANVLTEFAVKLSNDRPHLGPIPFFIYMGAEKKDFNITEPWFLVSALISVGVCTLALLGYKTLKSW